MPLKTSNRLRHGSAGKAGFQWWSAAAVDCGSIWSAGIRKYPVLIEYKYKYKCKYKKIRLTGIRKYLVLIRGIVSFPCPGEIHIHLNPTTPNLNIYSTGVSTNTRAMIGWPVGQAVYQIVAFSSAWGHNVHWWQKFTWAHLYHRLKYVDT